MASDPVGVQGAPDGRAGGGEPLSWADTARVVLPAFVITRLVIVLAGSVAVALWEFDTDVAVYDPRDLTVGLGGLVDTLIGPFARWDTVWLLDVAEVLYPLTDVERTAFFPLFPLLVRAVASPPALLGVPLQEALLLGGLVLSGACGFVGAMLVHRLAERELGHRAAAASVWALLAFPGSLWLTAVYTEGLFLLLSAGCLLAVRDRRWVVAGALAALAAATRSAGIILVVPILVGAWEAWRADPSRTRPELPSVAVGAALVPLGLVAFVVALVVAGHPWNTSFLMQQEWGRETVGPWEGAWLGIRAATDGAWSILGVGAHLPARVAWQDVVLLLSLVVGVVALLGAVRRLPLAYGAYAAGSILLPLTTPVVGDGHPLMSLPRFLAVLFPLAIWAGWWALRGPRWRAPALLATGLVLLAGTAGLTACWVFVA
ncbi:MAG: hypothetical protein M0P31_00325 [Solirubrobacteraceae bacterium]|nr:hypothetical protein [Solirubrobacteraceae bacterium]